MASNLTRLGEKLRAARIAKGIEQQQVAASIGVGRGAIRNIEKGEVAKITPTIRHYARIVGWTDDSTDLVAAGGEPVMADAAAAPTTTESTGGSDLAVDVQESLRRGPLLQSRVVEVPTPAGKVRATIVLRGEEGLSAEELLAALRAVSVDVSSEATGTRSNE
ncbi:helix-turn-helix transcriptional regulator [Streptomyces sp. CRN 30]|uniref:helix-turn-helix domain-containing protein n=1 Tax=Streptomyces sp. CRN 30 TaxID=3075613 RepID=UPI002A82F418|nr:helix-turn-helix transcriptional regulator [Streptomyces sp. CRN 30]